MIKDQTRLVQAVDGSGLSDGATISFHHHLRNGDDLMRQVLHACQHAGLRDIHIVPSALFPCHGVLESFLRDETVTRITTSYINGPLADAIHSGGLKYPMMLQTHGGRAHAIETGRMQIDAAYVAAPAADAKGNVSGAVGSAACGPLGYAMVDAAHATHVVAVTNHIQEGLPRICIPGEQIDQIARVNSIGDASQIVSGTTGRKPSDKGRLIADMTVRLIAASGLLRDGFNFQVGAGATSMAVAGALGPVMADRGITGSFLAGGITRPLVQMYRQGLFQALWDVQAFDLDAVTSYRDDAGHLAMSASDYASPGRPDAIAKQLDVMILGAVEVDTSFNVNVTRAGDGRIIGGSGGHADTAAGAALPIVTTTIAAGGYPKIVKQLTCLTTPGRTIGAVVTEAGVAIHPSRPDLAARARKAGLHVVDIEDLHQESKKFATYSPIRDESGPIIAMCEAPDGTVIDVIRRRNPVG